MTPANLEDNKDSGALATGPGSKPFGRAQSHVPMAVKPVATVPPMSTSKAMSSTQPTVPTKPKVSVPSSLPTCSNNLVLMTVYLQGGGGYPQGKNL